ncbi:Ig-like domain-containing protein [Noviherbaspirillum sp. ST9]|uniref:Ig-like domain-containing protein n=1 Tax=Noviherbaspirillum sp. ST9 TaxID=3401606 RepID=UPI003B587059
MKLGDIGTSVQKIVRFAACGLMALSLASCGGGGGSAGTVSGTSGSTATTPSSISLLFSSTELPSSGTAGTEVTVTALVKNGNNNAIASAPVIFTASSGALTAVSATTDANGKATALLSTSGDRTNRSITVTAKAGNVTTTGTVNVVGTAVAITGPSTVTAGGTGDFAITVRDQAGKAISGVPVAISTAKGNGIAIKSSGGGSASAAITNSQGQVVITVTGTIAGKDSIVASSQGHTFSYDFNVNTLSLTVTPAATQANVSTCTSISARLENSGVGQNGIINISTSRGLIYSDSGCNSPLGSTGVPVTAGQAQTTYIKSDMIGVATITGTVANGPTAQSSITFVAPLTSTATISVQPEPSVVSPSGTGQSNTSVLTVTVRDGTGNNNLVKGAVIEFSIVSDQSGGSLSNPSVVTTEDDGTAKVTFTAGPATTPANGVQIQARIQGTTKTATASLTVSRKSLFITAGTGNKLETPSTSTYRQDYTVFVTDASGNPVPEVAVTASVKAMFYRKGGYRFDSDQATPETGWVYASPHYVCSNEDSNNNGILDAGEDFNSNGTLEPRIPLSVTSSGKTDATGTAVISILYPRDRGNWTDVRMSITGSVQGTEAIYTTSTYTLPVLATDLSDQSTAPPGSPSPYGTNACNVSN